MLKLTESNYYSLEASQEYMNYSQYKGWLECEAMEYAKVWGGWEEPEHDALLLGKYVHAWSEGDVALRKFKASTPELFKKSGELYEKYKIADEIIDTLKNDQFCSVGLEGQKEVIFTAEFGGCQWKIKMDVYNPDKGRFADLKVMKGLHDKYWIAEERRYGSFIEHYKYLGQFAIYAEIERRANRRDTLLEPIMVAVTKDDPPDKAIITFDERSLNWALEEIEFNLAHILDVKSGKVSPKRCEKCRYCRETKKITRVISWDELLDV